MCVCAPVSDVLAVVLPTVTALTTSTSPVAPLTRVTVGCVLTFTPVNTVAVEAVPRPVNTLEPVPSAARAPVATVTPVPTLATETSVNV